MFYKWDISVPSGQINEIWSMSVSVFLTEELLQIPFFPLNYKSCYDILFPSCPYFKETDFMLKGLYISILYR